MDIAETKKQFAYQIDLFKLMRDAADLRKAANLIETVKSDKAASLEFWLTTLDALDSAKDGNFDPEDGPMTRIVIPMGTRLKPGYRIPTPDAIADPEDRQKYDDAVAANTAKTETYRLQYELRQMDAELTLRSDTYIEKAYPREAESQREMDAAIARYIHNPVRAAHLRAIVSPAS
jgi:hypothetical protein